MASLELEYDGLTYEVDCADYEPYQKGTSTSPPEGGHATADPKVRVSGPNGRLPDMDLDQFLSIYMENEGIDNRKDAIEDLEQMLFDHVSDLMADAFDDYL